jgi:hypothetical protein
MSRITDEMFAKFEQAFSDNAGLLGSARRRAALEAVVALEEQREELLAPFAELAKDWQDIGTDRGLYSALGRELDALIAKLRQP